MKNEAQVDQIMSGIPETWRTRWCGGERGECACIGCVQVGNRAVIAGQILGEEFRGDPEHISEADLQARSSEIYSEHKLSREEWVSWMLRHPEAQRKAVTGSGKSTCIAELVNRVPRD